MKLFEQFFKIIAPSECLGCRREGSLLCLWCVEQCLPDEQPRCYRCNRLSSNFSSCAACRRKTAIKHLWCRTEYTDIARQMVHQMKFKYSGEAADLVARELANTIPALSPDTVIVHVPTITSHVRSRGFDHTKRIAGKLSQLSGYRHLSVLARTGQHRQVGSVRKDRLLGVKDSFVVKTPYLVQGSRILLIDDVITTGATLEEAARVLKLAGAKSVDAVIFARSK